MIDGAERLLEVRGAVASNAQQTFDKINPLLTANAVKTFAHGLRDGSC
jgi:hypothetical protein